MNTEQNGKGDKPRPKEVTREQFDKNWDAIFGKKEDKEDTKDDNCT